MFVIAILSTNQRTACVARTFRHPFRRLSAPTEEYCENSLAQYGSVRVTPTFGGGNAIGAAPLATEPTRTLRWKRAISPMLSMLSHMLRKVDCLLRELHTGCMLQMVGHILRKVSREHRKMSNVVMLIPVGSIRLRYNPLDHSSYVSMVSSCYMVPPPACRSVYVTN